MTSWLRRILSYIASREWEHKARPTHFPAYLDTWDTLLVGDKCRVAEKPMYFSNMDAAIRWVLNDRHEALRTE